MKNNELIKVRLNQFWASYIANGVEDSLFKGEKEIIAQEAWVVIKGKVEVSYFNELGHLIRKEILEEGDVSITLHGGHTYTILEDALVYEFKTGPYTGQKNDKVFLKELDYPIL